jgi:hypothetical protein
VILPKEPRRRRRRNINIKAGVEAAAEKNTR